MNHLRSALIQSAAYDVVIRQPEEGSDVGSQVEIRAEYEVEVFQPNALVRLPVTREEVSLIDATIDGQTVALPWDEDGRRLSFPVDTPRRLQLTLVLRPRVRSREATTEFAVSVPPLTRASLRIKAPGLIERLEIPQLLGAVHRDVANQQITASLGPVTTLALRWPAPHALGSEAADYTVSELLLLKVQPNSVAVDGAVRPGNTSRYGGAPRTARGPTSRVAPLPH